MFISQFFKGHMTQKSIFFILPVNAKASDKLGRKAVLVRISIMHNGVVRLVSFYFDYLRFLFYFVLMHEGCKMEKL